MDPRPVPEAGHQILLGAVSEDIGQTRHLRLLPLRRWRSELPVARAATGRTLPALTNADIHHLLEEEGAARGRSG